ncbi:MAG TPA: ATP-binding protein [Vicinamibacterales bacterium]|nr:HAMP domain-containing protein [Acidobacteriota bacterium]HOC17602.1 ATP-binding protein [Vicinamibacterales bacterium]
MHLSIKAKQIGGISLIVGLAVVALSAIHLSTLVKISLEESGARADLLVAAIFQRARLVVPGQADPYEALRQDGGLRSILESSAYSKSVVYAAIVDPDGVAVVHSVPDRQGKPLAPAGGLDEVLALPRRQQVARVYSSESLTLEVGQPLRLGTRDFGAIRVGVSTLLIRQELWEALKPAMVTALIALALAILVAGVFTRLMLRPIHVIRGGLTRLGRGEFGVKLDLPQQDEFGELGNFFNAVSAQLSADRSQLAGQKANLEAAVEHIEDEVALINPAGELLFANPAMRRALPPESFGRPIDDVLPAGHPYRELVQATLREGQSRGPVSASIPGPLPPGAAAPEGDEAAPPATERLVMAHAIKDLDQQLVGVMLVSRDVEYMGRVQSMLNYSRKLVALGRLSAGVAHEVKNPLNAMTIHLELLKQKLSPTTVRRRPRAAVAVPAPASGLGLSTPDPVEVNGPDLSAALDHVKIIGSEIQRLDQVVQGFLKFTRAEDLKLQDLSLGSVVDEVVRIVEPECAKSGVALTVTGFDSLPPVSGDSTMLRQAFLNLALNACQAMPNGGQLRIAASPLPGRRVEVRFEDTGIGIKPEHLERIFDLYFTTRDRGSGIGLSMVYRIVQMHDGEIEVESTEGRGTTFRIVLRQA